MLPMRHRGSLQGDQQRCGSVVVPQAGGGGISSKLNSRGINMKHVFALGAIIFSKEGSRGHASVGIEWATGLNHQERGGRERYS